MLGEILAEVVEPLVSCLFEETISDENQSNRFAAPLGAAVVGAVVGGISLLVLPHTLAILAGAPVCKLVLVSIVTALTFEASGRLWVFRGNVRMALFTLFGGLGFGFGLSLVRLLYFGYR